MRMSADKIRSHHANGAHVMRIVISLVALSALAAFAIQAWFAYGFARYVWTLPAPLAFAVPVANDVYIVTLMVVSYLLRTAEFRVRIYIWSVLGLGIASQIGAAWSFEHWRSTGAHAGVSLASLVPAALLAAALHSLIIAARYLVTDEQGRAVTPQDTSDDQGREAVQPVAVPQLEPQRRIATPAERAAGSAPVTMPPSRPSVPPTSGGRRGKRRGDGLVEKVRELVASGVSCVDAGAQLGRSKRWAEIHTEDIRATRNATQGDPGPVQFQAHEIARGGAQSLKGIGPAADEMQLDLTTT